MVIISAKMENYLVLKQLGKGVQGTTYLVKAKESGQFYALKMIECLDESDANKAFREMMELQDIGSHSLICDIIEFFVHWETQISSMFFCIVTKYYSNGNLSNYLSQLNGEHTTMEESTIRMWLSEILESLAFAAERNLHHRDLKPSNIYIQDNNSHIVVGDFCTPTVFANMRTSTRCPTGSLSYAAPEIADSLTANGSADIWSAGCIGLQMMLTGIRGVDRFEDHLYEIKYSTTALEELFHLSDEFFSTEQLDVVRFMLNREREGRPDLQALMKERVIVKGMNEANRSRKELSLGKSPAKPLPSIDNLLNFFKHMLDNLYSETYIADAMHQLAETANKLSPSFRLDLPKIKVLLKAMSSHIASESVVADCLLVLKSELILGLDDNSFIYTREAIETCLEGMRKHPLSADVQSSGAFLIMGLAANCNAAAAIDQLRATNDLLRAFRKFVGEPAVAAQCLKAMLSLMARGGNVRLLAKEKVVVDIVDAVHCHSQDSDFLQAAFALLLGLTMNDENLRLINTLNCVQLILNSMLLNSDSSKLTSNGCLALAAIVEADEESAYRMLSTEPNDPRNGIEKIVELYSGHKQDPAVVSSMCTLFIELSHYDDIVSEMQHLEIGENVMRSVQKRFAENDDIQGLCAKVTTALASLKPLVQTSVNQPSS